MPCGILSSVNALERSCVRLRHHPVLENIPVWQIVRPVYNTFLNILTSRKGLERTINGTDSVRLHPRWRGISENCEPLVWKDLMSNIRRGDVVVDVGSFIGLYTIASAMRVGPNGSVTAFEPEPTNFKWLQRHVALNHVEDRVRLVRAAVGHRVGEGRFVVGRDLQSHMGDIQDGRFTVHVTTLDEEFPTQRVDLLKVDVEGFEERVLQGGARLLKDDSRCPRTVYIEVHPYAWKEVGTSSESLVWLLKECGYRASKLDGQPVDVIDCYGEVVAHKNLDNRQP